MPALGVLLFALLVNRTPCFADESEPKAKPESPGVAAIEPKVVKRGTTNVAPEIQWKNLIFDSFKFLAVQHAFRIGTEPGTREALHKIPKGYVNSLGNMHGWADGDEFYVNYIGHPMQGAVSGFIWAQNDPKYRDVEFGKDRRYWRSRMRATAFSWVYSAQFEIGPISEASIGAVQAKYPAQGFVDHVATPALGLAWMIGEDAIDKYIVRWMEGRTNNRWVKLFARGLLNPGRSFANVLGGRVPWQRDNRRGIMVETTEEYYKRVGPEYVPGPAAEGVSGVAPFEFTMNSSVRSFSGQTTGGACAGGGSSGAFRLGKVWQLVGEVNGCMLDGLPQNVSGDFLSYMAGPRWAPLASRRWSPYVQVLAGGQRVWQEQVFPAKQQALELNAKLKGLAPPERSDYAVTREGSGFAFGVGGGLDVRLNSVIALRILSVDYTHSNVSKVGGVSYQNGLHYSSGLLFRFGTW